jgi:hypothetical protein
MPHCTPSGYATAALGPGDLREIYLHQWIFFQGEGSLRSSHQICDFAMNLSLLVEGIPSSPERYENIFVDKKVHFNSINEMLQLLRF